MKPKRFQASDLSDAQADDAEQEDSSLQSSKPTRESKSSHCETKVKEHFVLNTDGSEITLNQRLSKKVNSMQRQKNREAKKLAAKAIRDAKPLPVKTPNEARKVGTERKPRRRKKRITKEGGGPEKHSQRFHPLPV